VNRPLREWLEFTGLTAAAHLIAQLDFRSLRGLAAFVGSVVYFFDARGRKLALANIEAAFPGKYSSRQKSRIARKSYCSFARTMFELFWAPNMNEAFVKEHVVIEGLDRDTYCTDPTKPAIYSCMHFCNFEWLSLVTSYYMKRVLVVAQKFRNPLLGPIFDNLRSSTGNQIIPQERAMLKMLKHIKTGGKMGILVDLNIHPQEGSIPIKTFGGLMISATPAHIAIAQRTGAVIVPIECRPLPDGRYKIIHHDPIECPPDADTRELAQKCWNVLEPGLREFPECWLWAYKHWRHKPSANAERYPFYASNNPRFDALLNSMPSEI
jgi:lauroyl/myristoyl acyltransferase